jgi:hypothetical protein
VPWPWPCWDTWSDASHPKCGGVVICWMRSAEGSLDAGSHATNRDRIRAPLLSGLPLKSGWVTPQGPARRQRTVVARAAMPERTDASRTGRRRLLEESGTGTGGACLDRTPEPRAADRCQRCLRRLRKRTANAAAIAPTIPNQPGRHPVASSATTSPVVRSSS